MLDPDCPGYVVLPIPEEHRPDPTKEAAIRARAVSKATEDTFIFNSVDPVTYEIDESDKDRRQVSASKSSMLTYLKELMARVWPNHTCSEPVDVVVLPSAKPQHPHTDCIPDDTLLRHHASKKKEPPLSLMATYSLPSTMRIWPQSHRYVYRYDDELPHEVPPPIIVQLPPFHMILFRGDLIHSGDSNRLHKTNVRLFMYVDHKDFHRAEGDTYYIRDKQLDLILGKLK
jgi:hypothetical protein